MELNTIVSSDAFSDFLKLNVILDGNYEIFSVENRLYIKSEKSGAVNSTLVECKGNIKDLIIKHSNLKKLIRFLKAIPNQPLNIIFSDREIECRNFQATFYTE